MITQFVELFKANPIEAIQVLIGLAIAIVGTLTPFILSGIKLLKKLKSFYDKATKAINSQREVAENAIAEKTDSKVAELMAENAAMKKYIITMTAAQLALKNMSYDQKESLANELKELTGEVLAIPDKVQSVIEDINEIKNIDIQAVLNGEEEASDEKTN